MLPGDMSGWREAKGHADGNGWTLLATGDWSWVYEVAGTATVWRITPFDPAFEVFVQTCRDHSGNPHLPSIEANHVHPAGGMTTVIERLEEVDDTTAREWLTDLDAGITPKLGDLREILEQDTARADVPLFEGVDRNPANVLQRRRDGTFVLTDGFWINGPLLLELVKRAPAGALLHYPADSLSEWAHLPCMDEATTALILRAIESVS